MDIIGVPPTADGKSVQSAGPAAAEATRAGRLVAAADVAERLTAGPVVRAVTGREPADFIAAVGVATGRAVAADRVDPAGALETTAASGVFTRIR